MHYLCKIAMKLGSFMNSDTSFGISKYPSKLLQLQHSPTASYSYYFVHQKSWRNSSWASTDRSRPEQHTRVNLPQPSTRQPSNARRLISCQQTHRGAIMMTCLMGHDRSSCTPAYPLSVVGSKEEHIYHLVVCKEAWRLTEPFSCAR